MVLDPLIGILSSSGAGAIIGGIFGWLGKREDRKTRSQDQAFELDRIRIGANADQQTSEARAFEASQQTISKMGDFIKSAMRPLITTALMYMLYQILVQLETITGGLSSLPPEVTAQMYREIILNIISLTAMAVSWWFASRPTGISQLNRPK